MAPHLDDPRSIARNEDRALAAVRLTREACLKISPEQAFGLSACNYTARIQYAQIATVHISSFTSSLPRSTPVFWVTLIRDSYTVPYDEAAAFHLFKLQQWVRAEFQDASFIGMTEAALYTNAGEVRPEWKRAVSWHPHLLIWGIPKQRMREIRDSINVRFRTLVPGVKPAHFRTLKPEEVEGQVLYMLKAPVNEYRIIPKTRKVVDLATAKTMSEPTGQFSNKKYQLGPGELVRMANLMAGKTLDGLAFAAGEGKPLLDAINFEARTQYRAFEARERGRAASQRSQAAARKRGRQR
jgi:hypothetical protein